MKLITCFLLLGAVMAVPAADLMGTWREGYKAAYAKAMTINSWESLWDWAEAGGGATVLPLRSARSTDRSGGRHSYIDTRAGGHKDACVGILDEMRFIGNHNSGDTKHFFKIMGEWIKMQKLDEIIPPGHF